MVPRLDLPLPGQPFYSCMLAGFGFIQIYQTTRACFTCLLGYNVNFLLLLRSNFGFSKTPQNSVKDRISIRATMFSQKNIAQAKRLKFSNYRCNIFILSYGDHNVRSLCCGHTLLVAPQHHLQHCVTYHYLVLYCRTKYAYDCSINFLVNLTHLLI